MRPFPAHYLRNFCIVVLLAGLASCMAGCTHTPQQVVREACDKGSLVEVCAAGIYETYVVLVEQSAAIAQDRDSPSGLVKALQDAETRASPFVVSMRDAVLVVQDARKKFGAGTGVVEDLVIASRNLEGWIAKVKPIVDKMSKLVKGGY